MRKIVISAGHSNTDPGATNGTLTEAHICTDFRNMVAHYLTEVGASYVTDGSGNTNLPLNQAVKLITPGALAVEFHCNAFADPKATGVETLSALELQPFGAALCETVSTCIGVRNRGAKDEGSGQHSRLAFVRAGGLILELFFISNPDDVKAYLDKKWVLARAVANTILQEAAK